MNFDKKFIEGILTDFHEEVEENINLIEMNLVDFEKTRNFKLTNSIMRGFHSLKGISRLLLSMEIPDRYIEKIKALENISHKLEDLTLTLGEKMDEKKIDMLYEGLDLIKKIRKSFEDESVSIDISDFMKNIENIKIKKDKETSLIETKLKLLINLKEQFFEYLINAEEYDMLQIERMKKPIMNILMKIDNKKLIHKFEEIIKYIQQKNKNSIKKTIDEFDKILYNKKDEKVEDVSIEFSDTIRVDIKKINNIMNLVGELITIKNTSSFLLKELYKISPVLYKEYSMIFSNLDKISVNLQEQILSLKMVPIKELLYRYKRLIRELAKEKNKKISYEISGENIELDRILLENLSDPLTHLIRNAIDHGIETIEERKKLGKNEEGLIKTNVYYESGYVYIEVIDDGRGIDSEKIRKKAKELGLNTEKSDEEIINYIFEPGFSTAEEVTEISGRGVGMDVVKNNIEKLNGKIFIETKKGQGTKITLKIPNSLMNVEGIMFYIEENKYIFPFEEVEKIIKVKKDKIHNYSNQIFVEYNDEIIPVFDLKGILENKEYSYEEIISREYKYDLLPMVIIDNGNAAILIDELIEENEFLVKPLPEYLKHKFIYGSTILGNGDIVLILRPSGLVI
ncbi:chemotaxis protein CheA [Marinitoga aeolica]|uniref:histidine kinase n=1 Tax=Marinitoga aeolica TaxID=2809031 RepID=A0ABY8PTC0_9BACT|nr:chemotaxis protein CheA [Marinitoga aeolica]WGS65859.1 chemotaxis protein CheA [Marinitoga aeolica]